MNKLKIVSDNKERCSSCHHVTCKDCEVTICEYELALVTQKLYYSLFQMTKSYLATRVNDSKALNHLWLNSNKKNIANKLSSTSKNTALDIFVGGMDALRDKRNIADYELLCLEDYSKQYKEIISNAKNTYNQFKKLENDLGGPQC